MPATKLSEEILTEEGIRTADLLIACELVSSRSEARRLILQGGSQHRREEDRRPRSLPDGNRASEGSKNKEGKESLSQSSSLEVRGSRSFIGVFSPFHILIKKRGKS